MAGTHRGKRVGGSAPASAGPVIRLIVVCAALVAGMSRVAGAPGVDTESDRQAVPAMQAALDRWESVCRRHLRAPVEPLPWIIFFDERYAWHVNPRRDLLPAHEAVSTRLRFAGRARPLVRVKNEGRLWVPGREPLELKPCAIAMPYDNDRQPFCIIALPWFWRRLADDVPAAVADELFFGAASHELTHTRQLVDVTRRIKRMRARYRLPENLDDNLLEQTFGANPDYKKLYEEERGHLTRAILADDVDACRRAVAQALAVRQERVKRFFAGEKQGYAELEDLFLVLEGVAMWAQYHTLRDRAPAGQDWRQTLSSLSQVAGSWSQEEGLSLFLLMDRLLPGWQRRFLAPNFPSPFAALHQAVSKPPP
jgi:hypothetical protein